MDIKHADLVERALDFALECAQEASHLPNCSIEVVEEAARYRWLRDYMVSDRTDLDDIIVEATSRYSSAHFDRVIDSLMADTK